MAQAELVTTGLSLLGGGSVLLATGVGLLIGLRSMGAVGVEPSRVPEPVSGAPVPG
jgi:hypothetical protein